MIHLDNQHPSVPIADKICRRLGTADFMRFPDIQSPFTLKTGVKSSLRRRGRPTDTWTSSRQSLRNSTFFSSGGARPSASLSASRAVVSVVGSTCAWMHPNLFKPYKSDSALLRVQTGNRGHNAGSAVWATAGGDALWIRTGLRDAHDSKCAYTIGSTVRLGRRHQPGHAPGIFPYIGAQRACAMRAVTRGELCTTMGISSKMSSQPSFASLSFSEDTVGPDFRYSSMNSSLSLMACAPRRIRVVQASA